MKRNCTSDYRMLVWAKANDNDIETQAKQAYDVMTTIAQIDYLKPIHTTAYRKKDVKEFKATFDNIYHMIIKNRDKIFPDLGSGLSFYIPSEVAKAGLSIKVGCSDPMFINNIVLNVRYNDNLSLSQFDALTDIFKQLVRIFAPFYGCISSTEIEKIIELRQYFDNDANSPSCFFDVNYLGKNAGHHLPLESIRDKVYELSELAGGDFIRLMKEPIDVSNETHMALQAEVNRMLGLEG